MVTGPLARGDEQKRPPVTESISIVLPAYLIAISRAQDLSMTIGFSSAPNELGESYELAQSKGALISQELDYVYNHGEPAGKVVAAFLIRRFDKTKGTRLLEALTKDPTTVTFNVGCIVAETTIGERACRALEGYPLDYPLAARFDTAKGQPFRYARDKSTGLFPSGHLEQVGPIFNQLR
jgi:hypothetical protein